jgi:hypothetical protein
MKPEKLELVRLGQGSVRHLCLPPDWLLRSFSNHGVLIGDAVYHDPDLKFAATKHRALCGRYGVPNTEPYEHPTALKGRQIAYPDRMPVCAQCRGQLERLGFNLVPIRGRRP